MISPERLRAYPYFAGANEESLRELAMASEELTFQEGQVLFREDQTAEHLYILIRGEVDIQYELNTGEHRTVDTVVAGDVLVWSALVRPYRTTALAIARRMSEVIAIDSYVIGTIAKNCARRSTKTPGMANGLSVHLTTTEGPSVRIAVTNAASTR